MYFWFGTTLGLQYIIKINKNWGLRDLKQFNLFTETEKICDFICNN